MMPEATVSQESVSYRRLGWMLVLIGALFAADSYVRLAVVYRLWPILIAVLAVGFLGIFAKRRRREVSYLAVGVYLFCFSVLALVCNFTSWGVLARLWPLFIAFLGAVFLAAFCLCGKRRGFLIAGLVLLSMAAVFFFFIVGLATAYWWTVFIVAGLSILLAEWLR